MKFAIASDVVETLRGQARAALPAEACGLLLGITGRVTRAVPARNIAVSPERGFEIDPATLLRAHRDARGSGEAVVGHYHSHPNGSSAPSRTDAARAIEDGQLWVIVADDTVAAWTMTATGFAPVEIVAESAC